MAAPRLRVFTAGGTLTEDFFAYPPGGSTNLVPIFGGDDAWSSGLHVGTVVVNGRAEILTGPGPGQRPEVKIFDGLSLALLDDFFAYDRNFLGGVFVGGS